MSQSMAVVKKRRTHEHVSEEETANCSRINDESSQWCNLPSIALEKIYSFLDYNNRYQMSLTCKNWSKEFSAPGLWRKVKFILKPEDSSAYPGVTFVQQNCKIFQHVEIVYILTVDFVTRYRHQHTQLFDLLEALARARLSTFVLKAEPIHNHPNENECTKYSLQVPFLLSFLSSQKDLTTVEFQDALFEEGFCSSIIEVFSTGDMRSLKHLTLSNIIVYEFPLNHQWIPCLISLETLEIDCNFFRCSFILSFRNYAKRRIAESNPAIGNLKKLTIWCRNRSQEFDFDCQKYDSDLWSLFKVVCPHLKLQINAAMSTNEDNLSPRIRRSRAATEMPLTALNISFYSSPHNSLLHKLVYPLLYIDGISRVETVQISWPYDSQLITFPVFDFVRSCPKLRELFLQFNREVKDLEILFILLLKDRPQSLEKLDFKFCSVVEKRIKSAYIDLQKKYVPLLSEINIQLRIAVTEKQVPSAPPASRFSAHLISAYLSD